MDLTTLLDSVNWPVAIGIVLVVSVVVLRGPLGAAIGRVRRAGRTGLEFEPQAGQPVDVDKGAKAVDELMRSWDNQLLVEFEQRIRAMLKERGVELGELESEKLLVRIAASSVLRGSMEALYSSILGSQVNLLRLANQGPVSRATVAARFELARAGWPEQFSSFRLESWLAFVTESGLLKEDGDSWVITVLGREFLKYLVEVGKMERAY